MCLECPNKKEFDKCWKDKKHLEEQHYGFCLMYPTYDRRQSHLECPNIKPRDLIPMHRQTSTHGEEAVSIMREYREKQIPHLWEERLKRAPLLPTAIRPLSNTPPVKHPNYFAQAALTQPSVPEKSKSKRPSIDMEYIDFRHDLVEISLNSLRRCFKSSQTPT